jgi:3-methyladenine DNA glycosylase AlkC
LGVEENIFIQKTESNRLENITQKDTSKLMRWVRHIARMVMKNADRTLIRNPEARTSLRTPRRRWEDNIKTVLK